MKYFFRQIKVLMAFLLLICTSEVQSTLQEAGPHYLIDCTRGALSIDFLYWRAFQEGLDSSYPTHDSTITANNQRIKTVVKEIREPHFKWNPGFRVSFEYEIASHWDMVTAWTHFSSHAHHMDPNASSLRWKINLDVVDLIARYQYTITPSSHFRPLMGLRGARINQKLHTLLFPNLSTSVPFISHEEIDRQRFSAVGPIAGFEADWGLGCGFSIYAHASLACVYGSCKIDALQTQTLTDAIDSSDTQSRLKGSLMVADVECGLRWQKHFLLNTVLALQAGLEHHRYFNYNRIGSRQDLSFDGMNCSLILAF